MHYTLIANLLVSVATLSGTAAAIGFSGTPFRRDMKLAAEMSILPNVMLSQKKSIHTIAHEMDEVNVTAEYVSVRITLMLEVLTRADVVEDPH